MFSWFCIERWGGPGGEFELQATLSCVTFPHVGDKSGIKGNYNVETGSILNKRGVRPSTTSKQRPSTKPKNAVTWKTAPVYPGVSITTSKDTNYTPGTG